MLKLFLKLNSLCLLYSINWYISKNCGTLLVLTQRRQRIGNDEIRHLINHVKSASKEPTDQKDDLV